VTGRRRAGLLGAVAAIVLLAAPPTSAHPLGNFSISHYAGIDIEAEAVQVRYLIDMAEIPTFQAMQDTGLVAEVGHPTVAPWLARMADTLQRGLRLEVGGRHLALAVTAAEIIFPPGAGDLPTLKLGVVYRAALDRDAAGPEELQYADENFPDRAGWKEIVVRGRAGVTILASTAPATDRSAGLADYPSDLLDSPPQDLQARVTFTREAPIVATPPEAPAPPVALQPNRQPSAANTLAGLVTPREPGAGIVAMALLVAVALGAFHALEPGHGKTVVAAYLVGSRGTARHALILGLVVTASHTAGVYLLGGVTFYASQHVVPERLYPWLSLGSGLTIAVLGAALFLRRCRVPDSGHGHHGHHHHGHHHGHPHEHDPAHEHDHTHPHEHEHAHAHGDDHRHEPVSLRALVALGVSGGIIPCPAALVVLLSALSMHRVGFGLVLIVAFSVGLAAVLVAIGILIVYAGRVMSRFREDGPWIRRWLPLTSSAVMTLLGLGIAAQALAAWTPR
jgi:ABC-type nickel/cobalt efflux system permease component RcnA